MRIGEGRASDGWSSVVCLKVEISMAVLVLVKEKKGTPCNISMQMCVMFSMMFKL
jgi:hypothetical protein